MFGFHVLKVKFDRKIYSVINFSSFVKERVFVLCRFHFMLNYGLLAFLHSVYTQWAVNEHEPWQVYGFKTKNKEET